MPAEKTRADSLREYLTGVASDGAAQPNPDASLGGYRSSTVATSFDITVTNPIAGINIAYAGGGNAPGNGTLNAVDTNTLQWKCADGSYGASVSIANGETKIVESYNAPGAYLRVTRTSAADLSGTATVTLTTQLNNVFGMDDVSSTEASSGDTEYRATLIKNESTAAIANFRRWIGSLGTAQVADATQLGASGAGTLVTTGSLSTWPESGFCHIKNGGATREIVYYSERTDTTLTVPEDGRGMLGTTATAGASTDTITPVPGIALAIDPDGVTASGPAIQTVIDENTAPSGLTWLTGITADTGLNIGAMEAGQQIGIWMKREVPPGAVATTTATTLIQDSFDAA